MANAATHYITGSFVSFISQRIILIPLSPAEKILDTFSKNTYTYISKKLLGYSDCLFHHPSGKTVTNVRLKFCIILSFVLVEIQFQSFIPIITNAIECKSYAGSCPNWIDEGVNISVSSDVQRGKHIFAQIAYIPSRIRQLRKSFE